MLGLRSWCPRFSNRFQKEKDPQERPFSQSTVAGQYFSPKPAFPNLPHIQRWRSCGRPRAAGWVASLLLSIPVQPQEPGLRHGERSRPPGKRVRAFREDSTAAALQPKHLRRQRGNAGPTAAARLQDILHRGNAGLTAADRLQDVLLRGIASPTATGCATAAAARACGRGEAE